MIARAEDASKISRISERFKLSSEANASIVTETEKSKDDKAGQPEPDIGVQEKAEKDKLLDLSLIHIWRAKSPLPCPPTCKKIRKSRPLSCTWIMTGQAGSVPLPSKNYCRKTIKSLTPRRQSARMSTIF